MKNIRKVILLLAVILAILVVAVLFFRTKFEKFLFRPTETSLEEGARIEAENGEESAEPQDTGDELFAKTERITVIAENLKIPWDIVFLPGGDILVPERPGNIKRLEIGGKVFPVEGLDVSHVGEGGLLGMVLHPRFSENGWLYLYLTTGTENTLSNRVLRYQYSDDRLFDKKIIVQDIPGAPYHDGGRLAFGPDGYLYITTGDAGDPNLAENKSSLAGKILRLGDDGSIPPDNPFGTAIYSYGHRNSQGLAWDSEGRLWATEHGRSGVKSGMDELNVIEKGKNYGWPIIEGDATRADMVTPVVNSGPNETWAPAGMAFWDNSFFFGGLRGESLYEAKRIGPTSVSLIAHFRQEFGRIRAVVLGPDGYLYITTSNTDGRGSVRSGDDKIIKINPAIFR